MTNYVCDLCDKTFSFQENLKRHKRTKHGDFRVYCDMCSVSTTTKAGLIRHMNTQHQSTLQTVKFTIQCPLCSERRSRTLDILEHYIAEHDIVISSEDFEFQNEYEFQIWKKGIEEEQVCEFVCKNQYKRKASEEKRVIYRCHRDGCFKSRSKAVRRCKILGTNKINGHCPAKMDVVHSTSGKVKVIFSKTHVGHQGEWGRLRRLRTERDDIAAKFALKIPFDEILDSVRISVCNDKVQHGELFTRKDLHNIARDYNLKGKAVSHNNDCTSVESWISEMQEAGGVVELHKPRCLQSKSEEVIASQTEEMHQGRANTADNGLTDLIIVEPQSVEEHDILNDLQTKTVKQHIEERKAQILRKCSHVLDKIETSEEFEIIEKHLNTILYCLENEIKIIPLSFSCQDE